MTMQGRPWAAGTPVEGEAGIDRVEADVEAEREVRLHEPARAAAVVDRLQLLRRPAG